MAWSAPVAPVSGTVITVAWAVANIVTPVNWLRTMTGGADPGASNRVVVSSSTTTTAWVQVPTDAIADGAITTPKLPNAAVTDAKLATAKLSNAGGTMTGDITFTGDGRGIVLGQNGTLVDFDTDGTTLFAGDDVFRIMNQAGSVVNFRAAAADAAPTWKGFTIWHSGNDGSGSLVDAGLLAGHPWHAGQQASGVASFALSTSFADVTSATITLNRTGWWLIIGSGVGYRAVGDTYLDLQIVVNGVAQTPLTTINPSEDTSNQMVAYALVSATSGHVAKLQARNQIGANASVLEDSQIIAMWQSP